MNRHILPLLKVLAVFTSILLFVIGIVLVVRGHYYIVKYTYLVKAIGSGHDTIFIISMATGGIVMFLGLFGYFAIRLDSYGMLLWHFGQVFLTALVMIHAGLIYWIAIKNDDSHKFNVVLYAMQNLDPYSLNDVQSNFQCCGVYFYTDYRYRWEPENLSLVPPDHEIASNDTAGHGSIFNRGKHYLSTVYGAMKNAASAVTSAVGTVQSAVKSAAASAYNAASSYILGKKKDDADMDLHSTDSLDEDQLPLSCCKNPHIACYGDPISTWHSGCVTNVLLFWRFSHFEMCILLMTFGTLLFVIALIICLYKFGVMEYLYS